MFVYECTVNTIGDIGAQSIGDGLKSLTSLTELSLSSERCDVICATLLLIECDCVRCDVQSTKLERLEHSPLVMVSSHLHHLWHWI